MFRTDRLSSCDSHTPGYADSTPGYGKSTQTHLFSDNYFGNANDDNRHSGHLSIDLASKARKGT